MPQTLSLGGFLAYYEQTHQNPLNRCVHHTAHSIAAIGILVLPWHVVLGMVLMASAFFLSWTGHYAFERNTPAFFDPPATQTPAAGAIKKIQVALGGMVWSGACFLRLFNRGPLANGR